MKNKRTAADEYKYDEVLRQEESVKTEVIGHLRAERNSLLASQEMLLTQLIATTQLLRDALASLEVYRKQALHATIAARNDGGDCSTTCDRHEWDTVTGWKKRLEGVRS